MKSKNAVGLMALVTATALILAALALTESGTAEPGQTIAITSDAEAREFEELIRRDQRILFEATVTGDYSLYATIYHNDPAVDMHPDYLQVLSQHGDEARTAVATLGGDVNAATTGYLTARIASLISYQKNVAAWEAAQSKAVAEDRNPSVVDLPEGSSPMERKTLDQWIEPDYHVFDVKLSDDHATAKVAFGPPEAGGQILAYEFTRVNGQWYISYMESLWSQGDPDYQGDGVP